MSDLVLQMFGSIAGSESLLLGFDDNWNPRVVMAEAPHGTAPSLFGKNLANPMAMILAGGSLLSYIGGAPRSRRARSPRQCSRLSTMACAPPTCRGMPRPPNSPTK